MDNGPEGSRRLQYENGERKTTVPGAWYILSSLPSKYPTLSITLKVLRREGQYLLR
jgi:hypothetical protein